MRTGVKIEDVTRAADELLARGDRPTVEGVRAVLGTGSPGTVNTLLKDYYKALPGRLNLPAPIATAAAQLYTSVKEAALAEVEQREAEQQASLKNFREQIEAERTSFETEKTQLRSQVTSLAAELAAARDQLGAGQRQIATLQTQLSEQQGLATTAEARAQSAIEERERSARKHQEEVAQLRERADGNERHLLAQIDDLKTQGKRLASEREKEQAIAAKRVADIEGKVTELTAEMAEHRKEAIRLNADLAREQRARGVAEAELKTQTKSLSRDLVAAKAQRDSAAAEREAERGTVDKLRVERDAAIKEGAVLQGRVETLQAQVERVYADSARPRRPRSGATS